MFNSENKNTPPLLSPENTTHMSDTPPSHDSRETDTNSELERLVAQMKGILEQARGARRDFLKEAIDKEMPEDDILHAAREAFNARQLPRIAFGERFRGSGYVVAAMFGEDIPEKEVNVVIDKDKEGKPISLVFELNEDDGDIPDEPTADDKDGYYVYAAMMPQVNAPVGSVEDWQEHVKKFQEVLAA
jgi:hypothetical protein